MSEFWDRHEPPKGYLLDEGEVVSPRDRLDWSWCANEDCVVKRLIMPDGVSMAEANRKFVGIDWRAFLQADIESAVKQYFVIRRGRSYLLRLTARALASALCHPVLLFRAVLEEMPQALKNCGMAKQRVYSRKQ